MSGADGRLNKVYPGLAANERAILVLRAWKEGGEEDPLVRRTMPPRQATEFNRYISLMNGVNNLHPYVLALRALVDQLGLRFAWLRTLDLWAMHAWTMAEYIWFHTKEPVTDSEHRRRVEAARAEMAPAKELAEILVERHEGWCDEDLVPGEDGEEPVVSNAAWERVLKDKKEQVAGLVAEGALAGKRQGRRVMVNAGSFYDWIGESIPVPPDWGVEFEVRPDEEADQVERLREARRRAKDALISGPSIDEVLRDEVAGNGKRAKEHRSWGDEIAGALTARIREETRGRWQELIAAERVIEEAAAEFDGEDPALPEVRQALQEARCRLEELVAEIQERVGPVDLEEGAEERTADLRAAMERLVGEQLFSR
jgi:hypothetical protein